MKKRIAVYFHRNKEDNLELADRLGMAGDSKAAQMLKYLGYEIQALFEIDTRTGEAQMIGAEGKFLGDESYESEKTDIVNIISE